MTAREIFYWVMTEVNLKEGTQVAVIWKRLGTILLSLKESNTHDEQYKQCKHNVTL
jgi:hypothetical protein